MADPHNSKSSSSRLDPPSPAFPLGQVWLTNLERVKKLVKYRANLRSLGTWEQELAGWRA
ncbi:hypothetical protein HanXRQr2_Chr05g0228491 [Helianthus annuus]|uniref:Uncharacterized protein n=1 Tax=Helianthus annuus TaxID=4232 RepID=A0A251UT32_HELAN|nr:hypothetical protein HanXRQr2_Chr05g0228481 [Helianthus annuus]KAF5807009.1 hypothetical protein HanXRQr2_Chr05g0228491 [Helianthus annuus]KAJ0923794.1 hypothetical protein HanPSC8_Chr05g0220531 [Helianthus annuus]KAJ0923795.1 hypothetical protein HanPSC8_Chr05g0220541 [Helianthus annuus]